MQVDQIVCITKKMICITISKRLVIYIIKTVIRDTALWNVWISSKKTGQYLIEYYPSLSINQSYHVFFLLLFQFDVTSILYRPHWHAQYQARSNDIHCNFHFELSVVLYFIPCNFETRSLGQRFGFVILQICIVFIVSLSSTWKTFYICVVCLFIWVSFFTFL